MTLDSTLLSATAAAIVRPVVLVRIDYPTGVVRVHSRTGTIVWDGHGFLGAGVLGAVGPAEEGADIAARTLSLQLTGIPVDQRDTVMDASRPGLPAYVWEGFVDAGGALIGEPVPLHIGALKSTALQYEAEDGAVTGLTVSVEIAGIGERLRTHSGRRRTHAAAQAQRPTDRSFEFVARLGERETILKPK